MIRTLVGILTALVLCSANATEYNVDYPAGVPVPMVAHHMRAGLSIVGAGCSPTPEAMKDLLLPDDLSGDVVKAARVRVATLDPNCALDPSAI